MLDAIEVLKEAKELGSTKTLADVDTLLANVDYTTLKDNEKVNYRVELWDKTTPINGVAPEKILVDAPEGGEIYLVYINDKLSMLQKHDPDQIGFAPMDETRAFEVANKTIDNIVERVVDQNVKKDILRQLLS